MPYDTRRKSLSLPSLGIQLPNASRAHRPSISKASPTQQKSSPPHPPPPKKVKRTHTAGSSSPTHPPTPRTSTQKNVSFAERPQSSGRRAFEDTPPTSPEPSTYSKYDTHGINDDIVVGVIEQLEKTGNRPHLIKELATVLSSSSDAVARYGTNSTLQKGSPGWLTLRSSANPGALLSSRLAAYIKRAGWTPLAPCPLDKELTAVHPRKIYYYLTTMPRQNLPADSSDLFMAPNAAGKGGKRIISPSISSASVDEDPDAAEERKRDALSPSPEVDLTSHDLDSATNFVPPGPHASFSSQTSLLRNGSQSQTPDNILSPGHRAASPPLEGDEREFTQTASNMRMRGMSLDDPSSRPNIEIVTTLAPPAEESEEEKAKLNNEAAAALFASYHPHMTNTLPGSSPLVKPLQHPIEQKKSKAGSSDGEDTVMEEPMSSILSDSGIGLTWDTREQEDIQLEDLDELFGAC